MSVCFSITLLIFGYKKIQKLRETLFPIMLKHRGVSGKNFPYRPMLLLWDIVSICSNSTWVHSEGPRTLNSQLILAILLSIETE